MTRFLSIFAIALAVGAFSGAAFAKPTPAPSTCTIDGGYNRLSQCDGQGG